jgi:2-isopropylmalate synthase
MHVHAVQRVAHSYEHIDPAEVGNERRVLVSELSGASNIAATLGKKFGIDADKEAQRRVLQRVQDLEHQGYHFEDAEASAELIAYEQLLPEQTFWQLDHYRCSILKRDSQPASTEATVKLHVGDTLEHQVAEGDGPVNALDAAMRRCLLPHYPQLSRVHLSDYKVRVVNPSAESAARVRATIEFTSDIGDGQTRVFSTVGVDENIIDASWRAIADAFRYHLLESQK